MDSPNTIKKLKWEYKEWQPLYELINKSNGLREFKYGDEFDSTTYSVVREIDHDHCICCMKTFSNHNKNHLNEGYFNHDEGWLCNECFKKLMN